MLEKEDPGVLLLLLEAELVMLGDWLVLDKDDPGMLLLLRDELPVLEKGIAIDVEDGMLLCCEEDCAFEDTTLFVL